MNRHFHKMQGCGNDFLVVDAIGEDPKPFSSEEAVRWCDRHFGIGADGLFILRRGETSDITWEFYNSDGSRPEMCGNAARCAIRFASEKYFPEKDALTLATPAGTIHGRMVEGRVEVGLNLGFLEYEEKVLHIEDNVFTLACVNTGVPHAVLQVKSLETYPVARIGRQIQAHSAFLPEGTNVTFFQRVDNHRILSTSFERGVEAETLACGTGAIASAFIFTEQYLQKFPIEVKVPGGVLEVGQGPEKNYLLTGPAEYVFEVEV